MNKPPTRFDVVLVAPGGELDRVTVTRPEQIAAAVRQIADETLFRPGDHILVMEAEDE
jgi:hypothetical protein